MYKYPYGLKIRKERETFVIEEVLRLSDIHLIPNRLFLVYFQLEYVCLCNNSVGGEYYNFS